MPSPVCSVIILAHNCLDYLPDALSSVAMQRCRDIETIVVDDGSCDATAAWLRKLADDWSGLRIIETDGIGPAKARNAGIELASAPSVAFLDAGDWWWPRKLEAQLAFHTAHPGMAFSFTDYLHVSQDGERRGTAFEHLQSPIRLRDTTDYLRLDNALNLILGPNFVGTSTVLASKAALEEAGGFDAPVPGEDRDLWHRLAAHSPVACSKSISTNHLVRSGGAASNSEAPIRLDEAPAELAQTGPGLSSAANRRSRSFLSLPHLRLRKAATASLLSTAFHFVGGLPASE
ncbi:MAG: glycosyltransferase family 2 protein [Rhodomicrobium sp.]